ncbi:MAG TPA: NAD(P)-dependent oxidoreductase [Patescibacteria group bacterium]|nr:NAD(P)-dependent oxidoreductase [Patescibacteria group bacterium]
MNAIVGVAGSKGFIGSHLCRLLDDRNIAYVSFTGNALREKDVTSFFKVQKPSVLIFLIGKFTNDRKEAFSVNVQTLQTMLAIGTQYSLNKVIFSSSGAVYGNRTNRLSKEDDVLRPISAYGLSKKIAESVVEYYRGTCNIQSIILRFPNIYGKDSNKGVFYEFKQQTESGTITVNGSGKQKRDFLEVHDACEAIIRCITYDKSNIFNIASAKSYSILELAKAFKSHRTSSLVFNTAIGSEDNLLLNTSEMRKNLGISFKDRIPQVLDELYT